MIADGALLILDFIEYFVGPGLSSCIVILSQFEVANLNVYVLLNYGFGLYSNGPGHVLFRSCIHFEVPNVALGEFLNANLI